MAIQFSNAPADTTAAASTADAASAAAAASATGATGEAATTADATLAATASATASAAPAAAGGFLDGPVEAPALGADGKPVVAEADKGAADAAAAAAKVTADAAAVETAVGKMTAEEKTAYDALSAEDKVKRDGELAADAAKEAAKPVYTEFTLPADTKVDDALLTKAKSVFADKGLSQDQAQAVIDLYSGDVLAAVTEAGKKPYDLWRTTQEGWQADVLKDPEIGGAKLEASKAAAARAISTFASPEEAKELRAALAFTGATNNPAIVRFFARVGLRVSEGTFVAGNPPAGPPKTAAQVLFPNHPTAAS